MAATVEMKEKILEAAIEEFEKKGLKFTMDDIAKNLAISKKTLYAVFQNKEEIPHLAGSRKNMQDLNLLWAQCDMKTKGERKTN